MLNKIIALVLTLIFVLSLAACVTSTSNSGNNVEEPSNVQTGGADKNKDKDDNDDKDTDNDDEDKDDEDKDNTEVTIEETVLLDEKDVKITAKGFEVEEFFGPVVKLLIENNSGKDLTFSTKYSSINGYMVDAVLAADVKDGKKANEEMTFLSTDLELCGIEEIADIELMFHIYTEDFDEYLDSDVIKIKTSIADSYKYKYDDSGDVVYDENDIKIVVKGLSDESAILGPCIVVYIENNTKKDVQVTVNDLSINGFMIDELFFAEIARGKKIVDNISFSDDDLESNDIKGIEDIEDVELSFNISNAKTWKDIADTPVIKLEF